MRVSTSTLNQLAVNAILDQQTALSTTQQQIATGKRILNPADDPVASVELLGLNAAQSQTQEYLANGQTVNTRLTLQEQALTDTTTTLQSVRDLVVQANVGSNNVADLKNIATNVQSLEQQLQGIANRQDAQGDYLFSGYSAATQPFVRTSTGAMAYVGDTGARSVPIGSGTSVQLGDPGSAIYMGVPTGNGTFTTAASTSNSGTGQIDTGSVTASASWVPAPYTITFTSASTWRVSDASGNPLLDASGNPVVGTYNGSSGSIAFNGIQVGISGAPAANDTFAIAPSSTQSVFTTLDNLTTALNSAGSSAAARAQLSSQLTGALQQIDQSMGQVAKVTTNVGARLSLISSTATSLNSQSTTLTGQISNLADLDYAAATARLSQQYVGLQAAELSYSQIAQLSLFKYL